MIPTFPEFKPIELEDRFSIDQITSKFHPYSDFNFTSLWSWNIHNETRLSQLNGNLVILFKDYISETFCLSFIGYEECAETAQILLEYSEKKYRVDCLQLVPEISITSFKDSKEYDISPDRDSHDYIYSVPFLANINTLPNDTLAQKVRQFSRLHPHYVVIRQLLRDACKAELLCVFERWAENRNIANYYNLNEYRAFQRLIESDMSQVKVISIYVGDTLVAFIIIELISSEYALVHFEKADVKYKGIYEALLWEVGKSLLSAGIKYLNFEQDLGITGIRRAKEKMKPVFFLKKYVLKRSEAIRLH